MKKAKSRSSVSGELFRSSVLFSMAVLTVFGLLFSFTLYSSERSKALAVNRHANIAATLFVDGFFREVINTIFMLAENADVRDTLVLDEKDRRRALDAFMAASAANENYLYVYAGYSDGSMIIDPAAWTPPEGFDPTFRPWYLEAM
ncbi:MAG: hypothetical protein PHU03_05100, partial [Syntrophales bacterium]|nr:hypothetical protein [Syntrophales bacterium]